MGYTEQLFKWCIAKGYFGLRDSASLRSRHRHEAHCRALSWSKICILSELSDCRKLAWLKLRSSVSSVRVSCREPRPSCRVEEEENTNLPFFRQLAVISHRASEGPIQGILATLQTPT